MTNVNSTDRFLIVRTTLEDDCIDNVIFGIRGIAKALARFQEIGDMSEEAQLLVGGLENLSKQLCDGMFDIPSEIENKIKRALAEPDTEAETLAKRLKERGLGLAEHVDNPGCYAVIDDYGRAEYSMAGLGEIERGMLGDDS